jgi:hypothetical protein
MTAARAFLRVHWVLAPTLLLLVVACLQPVQSIDLWIHLAVGREIAHDHAVPRRDTFSFTAPGHDFVAHEWLSQLALYDVYRAGGLPAIVAVKLLAAGVTFVLFYWLVWLRSGNAWVAAALVCLGILAARMYLDYRPTMFSYPLIVLLLLAIEGLRRGTLPLTVWLILAFGLSALWINLHGLAVAGLLIVVLTLAAEGVGALLRAGDDAGRMPMLKALALGLPLIVAGLCINPRGVHALTYPFQLGMSKQALENIHEWLPPDFHSWETRGLEAALLLGLLLLVLPGARRRISDIVLLVAFAHAALYSERHGALFVAVAVPAYAALLRRPVAEFSERLSARERRLVWTMAGIGLVVMTLMYDLAHFPGAPAQGLKTALTKPWRLFLPPPGSHRASVVRSALGMDYLPEKAVDYLRAHRPPGEMYNLYAWGGYLMFWAPEIPVFMDGRADVYYGRPLTDYLSVSSVRCGWEDKLDDWGVGFCLLKPNSRLLCYLKEHPDWREVYIDEVAVVIARATPAASGKESRRASDVPGHIRRNPDGAGESGKYADGWE